MIVHSRKEGVDPVTGLSAVRRFAAGWASGQGSSIELVHSSRVSLYVDLCDRHRASLINESGSKLV